MGRTQFEAKKPHRAKKAAPKRIPEFAVRPESTRSVLSFGARRFPWHSAQASENALRSR
jgi:hypothetical protein